MKMSGGIARIGVRLALAAGLLSACAGPAGQPPLALDVLGHGQPVVVLESGLGQTRRHWLPIAKALARCMTVVVYDRSGNGDSPPLRTPGRPVLAGEVANALLQQLQTRDIGGPFILVGHSIGGLYVQAFARNHPEETAGIVLIDAASPLEPPGAFVSTVPPMPGSTEAAEEAGVAPSVATLMSGPALPSVPMVVMSATHHGVSPEREALWLDIQRRTAALSPQGRLIVVDSGHFIQDDHPDAVVAAIFSATSDRAPGLEACHRAGAAIEDSGHGK
jgi:pimeloyl-ACP methyl ester carboxylesterase